MVVKTYRIVCENGMIDLFVTHYTSENGKRVAIICELVNGANVCLLDFEKRRVRGFPNREKDSGWIPMDADETPLTEDRLVEDDNKYAQLMPGNPLFMWLDDGTDIKSTPFYFTLFQESVAQLVSASV